MESALIRVLFLLFAMGVFGDAERVSVIEGESVTLHTGVTEIQRDDDVEWRLNVKRIAKISDKSISPSVAFRDGMQLDEQTGDLKITNIRTTDSGEYKLDIISETGSSEKIFSVSVVSGDDELKSVSVVEGDSVTLNSGTIIQRDDVIEWRFGDLNTLIAEINRKTGIFSKSDGPDGRFRDRLQLDYTTGSLTIWKIDIKHSGFYEAGIRKSSSGHTIYKSYSVTASGEIKSILSVMKGESVTLNSDLTEIQTDDLMQWMFGHSQIAEISKESGRFSTSVVPDGRFRDRLKLDHQTGSLTITHTRTTDTGKYTLKISNSRRTVLKTITVTVSGLSKGDIAGICVAVLLVFAALAGGVFYYHRKNSELEEWNYEKKILSVMVEECLTLTPDGVCKDDKLVWIFRGSCIAVRESGADSSTEHDHLPDGRFKDRLKLDPQTGSLTIPIPQTTDSGLYELLITRSGKSSVKRFSVSVFVKTDDIETVSKKEGESVTLKTGVDVHQQKDQQIQWKFGLTPLAKIKRGTKKISPFADKIFQGRVKLDHQTGSLIIEKIRPSDAGIYMQYIIEEGNFTTNLFRIKVDPTDIRMNPENVALMRRGVP